MKARKGYTKGMNRDMTSDKQDPMTYYNLENFRVVTEDGLTTGSLVNESSTILKFSIPDLEEQTLTDGTVIPAQTGLKIIGWTTIIDTLVVFTTDSDDPTPNSYGQIWSCKFDEADGNVVDTFNGELVAADHLLYNQKLNFSTYNRIGRAVGRYENAETQRVYWTDNHNSVRVFNIAIEDPLNTPLENIDLFAAVNMSQPVPISIGTGNLETGAMVQFVYKLKTTDGAETIFSPASVLTPLTESSVTGSDWEDFEGDGGETIKTRSVDYEIIGIDPDWDVIEHYAILYTELDVFTIYLFKEQTVPESGNVTVTCDDLDEAIEITGVEYNVISSGFDVAKDIVVQKNRLVAANTKTTQFKLDYDARAYRFDSGQNGLLQDGDAADIVLAGSSPDYASVPSDFDAINPYNDENQNQWDTALQYKYQADGTTIGGSGPNISYRFVTEELPANFIQDSVITQAPPHLTVNSWPDDVANEELGVLDSNGNVLQIQRNNQLKNAAAPYQTSFLRGYSRGEVYRFGIVFYGPTGSPTYVNWIGDIRFPEPLDDDDFAVGYTNGSYLYMKSIGIEFTVDTSGIEEKVSGYSIVRVRREEKDRSRLGTGMLMWWEIWDINDSLIHNWEAWNDGPQDGVLSATAPWDMNHRTNVGGSQEDMFHLPTKPGTHEVQNSFQNHRRLCFLLSPLGQNVEYQFKEEDYVKTYGYYGAKATQYDTAVDDNEGDRAYGFYYKTDHWVSAVDQHTTERFQVNDALRLRTGEYLYPANTFIDGITGVNGLGNVSASRQFTANKDIPLGIGNWKVSLMLAPQADITIEGAVDAATDLGYLGSPYQFVNFSEGSSIASNNAYFKEVAMCRFVTNQYGGNTYENRSVNQYMDTGHYQTITDSIPDSITFDVYGGDVFVNYLDDEFCEQYWSQTTPLGAAYDDPIDNKLSVVACFPTESIVNQDYRRSRRWFVDRDFTNNNQGAYQSNTYTYKSVWSQESIAKETFFAEDFLSNTVEEHPHQMWASEPKIDGELSDSWRLFQALNSIEVTGIYGPINRIMSFGEKIYFYQNSAVGITSIDERVVLNDSSGQALTIGDGEVFPDYQYISVVTGSSHQFSVVNTERYIYHWDARLKKIYRTNQQGSVPISDLKGMSSFFHNLTGEQLTEDITLRAEDEGGPVGVHAVADYRYNRVLFTFLDPEYDEKERGFTISYNEIFDAFESFYGFIPKIYLQYGRRLLSATPEDLNGAWEHNTSEERGQFYGSTKDSVLETILGDNGHSTKTFDTLQWQSAMVDSNGADVGKTFNFLRVYNDHQDSGVQPLVVDDNVKRRFRLWRTLVPRDNADNDPRIRAPWTHVILTANNDNHYKHTVKDIEYSYRPSKN